MTVFSSLPRTRLGQFSRRIRPESAVSLKGDGDLAAASSTRTRGDGLADLAESDRPAVRAAVAANPHALAHSLQLLRLDADVTVRAALATNPSLPDRVVHKLASDPSVLVRDLMASHPRLATADLERLLRDAPAEG
jgi:hypothetical protein